MNKVIDKGFRSCRFVSTIVKHPVYIAVVHRNFAVSFYAFSLCFFCRTLHSVIPDRLIPYADVAAIRTIATKTV